MAKIRITLVKSPIGYARDQKATVRNLGLGKMWRQAVHEDNPSIRGMIHKVRHLVEVEVIGEEETAE